MMYSYSGVAFGETVESLNYNLLNCVMSFESQAQGKREMGNDY